MSNNTNHDLGHKIGETVRSALQSGDLSRLKDIGPLVTESTKNWDLDKKDKDGDKGKKVYSGELSGSDRYKYKSGDKSLRKVYGRNLPVRYGPRSGVGVPSLVLGIMGIVGFGVAGIVFAALGAVFASRFTGAAAIICGTGVAFSAMLTARGGGKIGLSSRLRKYCSCLEEKNVMTFEQIAAAVNMPEKKVRKDIKKGIKKGILNNIRIDVQETTVMYGEDVYQLYLESEEARKQRDAEEAEQRRLMQDPDKADIVAFKAEGERTMKLIRKANDEIPGEEISSKLHQLELTTGKIFSYVEKHPEKLPDTRRFMEYYLPTTLKLVDKYRQYDCAEVQVKSIVKSKLEIEDALDTINHAFLNMLDNLYAEDTLDISTDISVLQTMLAQEGLTGKTFKINKEDRQTGTD